MIIISPYAYINHNHILLPHLIIAFLAVCVLYEYDTDIHNHSKSLNNIGAGNLEQILNIVLFPDTSSH